MNALVVVLIGTIIGGLIGYIAFWLRPRGWDCSFHHLGPLFGLLISFAFAGDSVFRGALVGLVGGAFIAVAVEIAPW